MKKCPFCAEDIQEEAIKCRYCGEFLQHRTNSRVPPKYLSIPELSEYLNIKPRTIKNWIYKAEIPFNKFGRLIRFDIEKIKKWIKTKEIHCFRNQYN